MKFRLGRFAEEVDNAIKYTKFSYRNCIARLSGYRQQFIYGKELGAWFALSVWAVPRSGDTTWFELLRTEENAENRLEQKINNSLKEQIAKRTTEKVVAGDRSEIMSVVQKALDLEAIEIGVEVVDVRLKRVDLADQIQSNVYSRMRSERKRIANESRAQGEEKAIAIEASAQRTEVELIAEAEKKAQLIRGEADALATKVFADSFGQDVEFYDFYRSLNAYRETFNSSGDLIVLDPNSDFFKHFNSQVK